MKSRLKLFFTLAFLSMLSPSLAWNHTSTDTLEPSITRTSGTWLGEKLSSAGDFNGDGIEDVLVMGYNFIVVHIIFGNPNGLSGINPESMTPSQGITITPERESFYSFVSAGDLNGDGIDDILLSDYSSDTRPDGKGSVFIIYGKRTGLQSFSLVDLTPDQGRKIVPGAPHEFFGTDINVGDFNGDGKQDIFISSSASPVPTNNGVTIVLYGRDDWPFIFNLATDSLAEGKGFKIIGESGSSFSKAVSVGDVNGDGRDDLIARTNNFVYVIWGDPSRIEDLPISSLTSNQGIKIQGVGNIDIASESLAVLGDVNGDGINDFAIASWSLKSVFVIFGGRNSLTDFSISDLPDTRGFIIRKSNPNDAFASRVFRAKDLNGDGLNDILVRSVFEITNGTSKGSSLYIVYGSTSARTIVSVDNIPPEEGLKIKTPSSPSDFTFSVSAVDINGDKAVDVLFGSYKQNPQNGAHYGGVYILYQQPCADGLSFNQDTQTCQTGCSSPWIAEEINEIDICRKPCKDGENWNIDSKTCQETCDAPWIARTQDDVVVCEKPCMEGFFWNTEENWCQDQCPAPWVISIVNDVEVCESPCESGEIWDEEKQECVDPDVSLWAPTLVNNLGVILFSSIIVLFK